MRGVAWVGMARDARERCAVGSGCGRRDDELPASVARVAVCVCVKRSAPIRACVLTVTPSDVRAVAAECSVLRVCVPVYPIASL